MRIGWIDDQRKKLTGLAVVLLHVLTQQANAQMDDVSKRFAEAMAFEQGVEVRKETLPNIVSAYRRVLLLDPRHLEARKKLSEIGWETAVQMELKYAQEQHEEAAWLGDFIRNNLNDILWRTEYNFRQENAKATQALALFHQYGILVERDEEKACELFEKASGENLMPAVFRHALCKKKKNPDGAKGLLRKAARLGHPEAQHQLGEAMLAGSEENREIAADWIRRAASHGRPSSQALLAWLYQKGVGVPKDENAAFTLYSASAAKGNPIAQNNLGEILELGRTGKPNPAAAVTWYRKSAEQAFPPAQINLSRTLTLGIGVENDKCEALKWAKRANKANFKPAAQVVDWLEKNSKGCSQ